jgi:hypothetical protein
MSGDVSATGQVFIRRLSVTRNIASQTKEFSPLQIKICKHLSTQQFRRGVFAGTSLEDATMATYDSEVPMWVLVSVLSLPPSTATKMTRSGGG